MAIPKPRDTVFVMRKFIEEKRSDATEEITKGLCPTHADYKAACARIQAFNEMEGELDRMVGEKNKGEGEEVR